MPNIPRRTCGRTASSLIVDEFCGRVFLTDEGIQVSNNAEVQRDGLQFGSNDAGFLSRFPIVLSSPAMLTACGS